MRKDITSLEGKKISKIAFNTKRNCYVFYTGEKRMKILFTCKLDDIFDGEGMYFNDNTQLTVNS